MDVVVDAGGKGTTDQNGAKMGQNGAKQSENGAEPSGDPHCSAAARSEGRKRGCVGEEGTGSDSREARRRRKRSKSGLVAEEEEEEEEEKEGIEDDDLMAKEGARGEEDGLNEVR